MFKDISKIMGSTLRVRVLVFFIGQSEVWGNARDVACVLGAPRASVQKELTALVHLRMLRVRKVRGGCLYHIDEKDGLFTPIQTFVRDTLLLMDVDLASIFRTDRNTTLVVASGVITQEPRSSVDILIVSKKPNDKKTERIIKKAEAFIALPIRYVVLEEGEYHDRTQAYDRMLRDIFEYNHRVLFDRGT